MLWGEDIYIAAFPLTKLTNAAKVQLGWSNPLHSTPSLLRYGDDCNVGGCNCIMACPYGQSYQNWVQYWLWIGGPLILRFSKPQVSVLKRQNYFENWSAAHQQCYWDTCKIVKWLENSKILGYDVFYHIEIACWSLILIHVPYPIVLCHFYYILSFNRITYHTILSCYVTSYIICHSIWHIVSHHIVSYMISYIWYDNIYHVISYIPYHILYTIYNIMKLYIIYHMI